MANIMFSDAFLFYRTALGRLGAKNKYMVERYSHKLEKSEKYEDDDLAERIRCECYREFLADLQTPADLFLMSAEWRDDRRFEVSDVLSTNEG